MISSFMCHSTTRVIRRQSLSLESQNGAWIKPTTNSMAAYSIIFSGECSGLWAGGLWPCGRALNSELGPGFDPHTGHCVVSFSKAH